jgi:hypothetical protein
MLHNHLHLKITHIERNSGRNLGFSSKIMFFWTSESAGLIPFTPFLVLLRINGPLIFHWCVAWASVYNRLLGVIESIYCYLCRFNTMLLNCKKSCSWNQVPWFESRAGNVGIPLEIFLYFRTIWHWVISFKLRPRHNTRKSPSAKEIMSSCLVVCRGGSIFVS